MSATARKRKEELAQALRKLIQSKGKTPALKYQQLFDDLRAQSDTVSFLLCFYISLILKAWCFSKSTLSCSQITLWRERRTLTFSADVTRKPMLQIKELNLCCILLYSGFWNSKLGFRVPGQISNCEKNILILNLLRKLVASKAFLQSLKNFPPPLPIFTWFTPFL